VKKARYGARTPNRAIFPRRHPRHRSKQRHEITEYCGMMRGWRFGCWPEQVRKGLQRKSRRKRIGAFEELERKARFVFSAGLCPAENTDAPGFRKRLFI
jgi:hypothetical protein